MRRILGACLALGLMLLATQAWADDKPEPKALIDKAIKAVGGEDKLAKHNAVTWSEKGTYYGQGAGLPYTGKYAVQWPSQFKMEIENVFVIVLNGDKGWIKMGNDVKELTKEQLAEQKENNYSGWLTTLTPLKGKEFTFATLGEMKIDNKPALGIKVSSKGHRDVDLYFDKDSGLLVKSEFIVKSEEMGGKEVNQEVLYANYKEVDGCKVPMKITIKRDGKLFVEAESSDVKAVGKLEDSVFGKP